MLNLTIKHFLKSLFFTATCGISAACSHTSNQNVSEDPSPNVIMKEGLGVFISVLKAHSPNASIRMSLCADHDPDSITVCGWRSEHSLQDPKAGTGYCFIAQPPKSIMAFRKALEGPFNSSAKLSKIEIFPNGCEITNTIPVIPNSNDSDSNPKENDKKIKPLLEV